MSSAQITFHAKRLLWLNGKEADAELEKIAASYINGAAGQVAVDKIRRRMKNLKEAS